MTAVATFDAGSAIAAPRSPADLPTAHKVLALGIMSVGFFIAYLDIQIVAASIKEIGGGLSASQDEVSWVQTSYLIAEIIVIPLSGWLSRVMSTRWLFTAYAAGFTLASALCASAWDIHSMIVFRALQGFLGGSMIPLVFTSALTFFQGKQRVIAASLVGALASLGPTFGPVVGGWITDNWSWHWLFYVNVAPGLLVTLLVPLLVDVDRPNLGLLKGADYAGMMLMAVFLGCLEYVLEEGPRWDWLGDDTIRHCAWISAAAGVGFVIRSLTFAQPVVDLRALKIRNFALGSWFSFITGLGIFSTVYLTPLFLGRIRGFDAWQIGTALLSAGVFQLVAVMIYGAVANRIDLRWLLMFGLACFAVAMWMLTSVTHEWGWRELLIPQAFRGLAQQFCVAPVVTLTLGALAPDRLKSASGLFNLMRNLGGAIGIAACGTILNDRANLHFHRIADHLGTTNANVAELIDSTISRYAATWGDPVHAHAATLKSLWLLAFREAQVQAFADAYLMITACFVLACVMVPLMRKVAPPQSPSADAH
ncbi:MULTISPECIES: DHA2 family efflux MFS transporter permease subunit [unclassified Bradyrhizobium]|uniref:DHA2 family efflux MFS transporter permease subunit n=1 Tax=unclassified Bradyrhizobium TaxID=2631580 RepID=UPI001FFA0520|nr:MULTISPECIES: DHA2 family efflux MFS transporter permease subunit [unclassified Bradyrhizobium]MCK1537516.1 DHA2 family efflux MFS transporter permease subunit [Bradyrhizobium sp. 176]MCK1554904.1 DHA2 family efflux MFS transporter permease subunit [Bradyrhizobium sp. 171]